MVGKLSTISGLLMWSFLFLGFDVITSHGEVDVAAQRAEGAASMQSLAASIAATSDASYYREVTGGSETVYDPYGNLNKQYYDTHLLHDEEVADSAAVPMKQSRYPSYRMYHPVHQYPPSEKPVLNFYPCCLHSHPQQSLNIEYNPKGRSPQVNCRALTTAFLKEHKDEHYFHRCTYGTARGGPADQNRNRGVHRHSYASAASSDLVLLARGSCVNVYFRPEAGSHLHAPKVDGYGKCATPSNHPRSPNMNVYDAVHQRLLATTDYTPPDYLQHPDPPHGADHQDAHQKNNFGFDYLLECSCVCDNPRHMSHHKVYDSRQMTYT